MNALLQLFAKSGLLKKDLDYYLLRAAMVVIFAWFGYDKWFQSEITALEPLITHGPLIFWTIPVLGIHGTAIFLGTAEWTFGTLLCWASGTRSWACWGRLVPSPPSSPP
jgi:hypothetical protein